MVNMYTIFVNICLELFTGVHYACVIYAMVIYTLYSTQTKKVKKQKTQDTIKMFKI